MPCRSTPSIALNMSCIRASDTGLSTTTTSSGLLWPAHVKMPANAVGRSTLLASRLLILRLWGDADSGQEDISHRDAYESCSAAPGAGGAHAGHRLQTRIRRPIQSASSCGRRASRKTEERLRTNFANKRAPCDESSSSRTNRKPKLVGGVPIAQPPARASRMKSEI